MKKTILRAAFIVCVAAIATTSCTTTETKAPEATPALEQAKAELKEAKLETNQAYMMYKAEAEKRLADNEEKLTMFREKMKADKQVANEKLVMELNELAAKNAKLKADIIASKESTADKWDAFKLSFNKDLDEVGKSISTMAETNIKKNNK